MKKAQQSLLIAELCLQSDTGETRCFLLLQ